MQPVTLVLKVTEAGTERQIPARISISRPEAKQTVEVTQVEPGLYRAQFMLTAGATYKLSAESEGYMFKNLALDVPASKETPEEIRRKVELDKLKPGYSAVLRNIYFDFAKASLKSESNEELEKLKRILEENPAYFVEISGHTDNVGSKPMNKSLSENRAKAVVNYLVRNGIPQARLFSVGYGSEKPIATNDDEVDGRELNRRVEFEILTIKQF